jgi:geranylgeranyl reductase family protein
VRVLLLDAKRFPREKPCGGGVQHKASLRIPFDWNGVVHSTLQDVSISFNLKDRFTRGYSLPLVHSVLRREFDQHLLSAARAAGAVVFEGVRVTACSTNGSGGVEIATDAGPFFGDVAVGADGAYSVLARSLNQRADYFWQAAIYCEIPDEFLNLDTNQRLPMSIDWGSLPSGYAWIFPKRGYVNVGVGCPASIARLLRPYLLNFLDKEHLLLRGALPRLKFVGHQLPTMTSRTALAGNSIVLVGDAAGLVEPLTGDGISYACHSAQIAADVILDYLRHSIRKLDRYERRVREEIGADLLWSRRLLSLAVTFPRLIHGLVKNNDEVWETFCRVMRGEETFRSLTRTVLGPLQYLRKPIELVAEQCERRRLVKYAGIAAAPTPSGA